MPLYFTDTTTGEMTELDVSRLAYPPKRTRYNRPVRRYNRRRVYPLNDLVLGVGCCVLAFAILLVPLLSR